MQTFLVIFYLLSSGPLYASSPDVINPEDADLSFIPKGDPAPTPLDTPEVDRTATHGKTYIENTFTHAWNRSDLKVPIPSSALFFENQNRTSADLNYEWQAKPYLNFHLSDRFSVFEQDQLSFGSQGSVRNDLREAFASVEIAPGTYLEAGRINIRNGVALGHNPTDYFKTRTLVSQASADPSTLRENRLGVVLAQAQKIWPRGSVRVAFAPKVQGVMGLTGSQPPPSLDLLLGRTNSENRLLISANYDVADLSPQALLFHDADGTRFGFNANHLFGSSVIGYLEWSGGVRPSLSQRAIAFGKMTGTLPAETPLVTQTGSDGSSEFQNDLVAGASWTSDLKLTFNLEYVFHQSGFSSQDFATWLALGQQYSGVLWFERQFAADQMEPLMQHQIFLRAHYPDAFVRNLGLGSILFLSPYAGVSAFWQLSATYFLSRAWTLGAFAAISMGSADSEKGSLPQTALGALQMIFYL